MSYTAILGDTLGALAARFGVSWQDIVNDNQEILYGTQPTDPLTPGFVIYMPPGAVDSTLIPAATVVAPPSGAEVFLKANWYYFAGAALLGAAWYFGSGPSVAKKANPLSKGDQAVFNKITNDDRVESLEENNDRGKLEWWIHTSKGYCIGRTGVHVMVGPSFQETIDDYTMIKPCRCGECAKGKFK